MKTIFKDLIPRLYEHLDKKFEHLDPRDRYGRFHESNIVAGIAEIAHIWNFFVISECNIKNNERADALIICPSEKWICQVEVKFQPPSRDAFDYDFWRVSEYQYIQSYLQTRSSQANALMDFQRFGLFIAAGYEPLYSAWRKPEDWLNGWFITKDKKDKQIAEHGVFPEYLPDKKFGLAYYLIEVTEDNTEEWLNNF